MGKSLKDLIKKYENTSGKTKWLSLQNDGDSATVRFLHKGAEDLDVYEVHEVEVDGYTQKIKCLGENCVFCEQGLRPKLTVILQMMDLEDGNEVKVWQRGVNDLKKILGEIEENGNLNERDYKIKRMGKKGSNTTTYSFYAKDKVERKLAEKINVEGFIIRVVTPADMVKILEGDFTFKREQGSTIGNTKSESDDTMAF